jgi:hypothetical protein
MDLPTGDFRPLGTRAKAAIGTLAACTAAILAAAAIFLMKFAALSGPSEDINAEVIDALDSLLAVAELGMLLSMALAAVAFLMWFYRANRNVTTFIGPSMRQSAGWAVISFFVPFFCWVVPVTAMKDIWNACHLKVDPRDPRSWRKAPTPGIIYAWWATWLTGVVVSKLAPGMAQFGPPVWAMRRAALIGAVGELLLAAAALLAISMVWQLTKTQTKLFAEAEPDPVVGGVPDVRRADQVGETHADRAA